MFLKLSRILSHSNCILILIIFNLVSSAPLQSQNHSPFRQESGQGFSSSPKILEIQLPLKISTKEDLIAWSKYVTSLMASKINFPSILKNTPLIEKRFPFISSSGLKSKETMTKAPLNEKRINYPARRLKEPLREEDMQRPDEKVVAYPLPIGAMAPTVPSPQNPSSLSTSNFNVPTDFGQYTDFNIGNFFQQNGIDAFGHFDFLQQPPSKTYLPPPPKPIDTVKSYEKSVNKNISSFEEPPKLQTAKNSLNLHIKTHNNEFGQALPFAVNNELTELTGMNLSHMGEPLLTFPFQAVVTISKELPAATMSKDYTAFGDFPNEFLPYFDQNYTLTNESGQVIFNDFTHTSETKTRGNVKKGNEGAKGQNIGEPKKQNQKKVKSETEQKSSIKRQSAVIGDLLRMLGVLRKLPKNSTDINIAKPILSILKGTNSKIQVAFDETPPNRETGNETFQAQQLGEDNDNENDNDDENNNGGNGNGENDNDENGNGENDNDGNGNNGNDDDGSQTEAQEDDDDDDEEEGGSIQALIDILPLAAPILEELSDPDAEVDIPELLQSAIPLLEGLSDPDEEGGVNLPEILLPLSQKFSQGPGGNASDSGAILGPIIQLIAPLIGPLAGPLIGPLSRSSSGPDGLQGSASVFSASAEPLSKPQGPYGQSVFSGLVASITAKLSKELATSAGDSDVKSLVSSIVSGVLAGASAGSKGQKGYGHNTYGTNNNYGYGPNAANNNYGNRYGQNGNRDAYHSPTTYGGYTYGYKPAPPSGSDILALVAPFKEVLAAFLKLSAMSSTSSANLSGASSGGSSKLSTSSSKSSEEPQKPTYGPPAYGPPPTYTSYASPPPPPPSPSYASPPSTNSPYVSFTRRQIARKQIKKI